MDIAKIYDRCFEKTRPSRQRIWEVLCADFFQQFVRESKVVADLGCGEGQFINNIRCAEKHGLDLNLNSQKFLKEGVTFHQQDSTERWPFDDGSLDIVFTGNFFEHLPTQNHLELTLEEAHRCLKSSGVIIALGPNANRIHGSYWDFWDHQIAIADLSLEEVLEINDFITEKRVRSFIPYTHVGSRECPMIFVKRYPRISLAWRFFGRRFLLIARK